MFQQRTRKSSGGTDYNKPYMMPWPINVIIRTCRNKRWVFYILIVISLLIASYFLRTLLTHEGSSKPIIKPIKKDTTTSPYKNEGILDKITMAQMRQGALETEKREILKEMNLYQFPMSEKEYEKPIRNVIVTNWRSGSSILEGALDAHPGMFYHNEPLEHFGMKQVRAGPMAKKGMQVINSLLNCQYDTLDDYINYGRGQYWLLHKNSRLWKHCQKNVHLCYDANFLSEMCDLFPFQTMKTVRFRLRLAKGLLENKKFNARLLLLVRDPRGTLQARVDKDWCIKGQDCYDPRRLCLDLQDDFVYAEELREKYPDRFLIIRYEDLSEDPHNAMKKIFKFFRLMYHKNVEKYLSAHTTKKSSGPTNTFKDVESLPFQWKNEFVGNFTKLVEIQKKCEHATNDWGYLPITKENELLSGKSMKEPPFPEMKIQSADN